MATADTLKKLKVLTPKVPLTTAADNIYKYLFIVF